MSLPKELFLAKILPRRKPMAFLRGRTLNFEKPLDRLSASGGGGPRSVPRKRDCFWGSAAAEFRASFAGTPPFMKFLSIK